MQYKFRGKDLKGRWHYGLLHRIADKRKNDKGNIYPELYLGGMHQGATLTRVIPETVGMFSGCFDRSGKEIYEGDIIRYITPPLDEWTVKFESGSFIGVKGNNICLISSIGTNKGFNVISSIHD